MNGHHCPELPAPPPEGVAEAQALVFAYVPQWVSWNTYNGHAVSQKGLTANTSPLNHTSTNTQTSTLHTHTQSADLASTHWLIALDTVNYWMTEGVCVCVCTCVYVCVRVCVCLCVWVELSVGHQECFLEYVCSDT